MELVTVLLDKMRVRNNIRYEGVGASVRAYVISKMRQLRRIGVGYMAECQVVISRKKSSHCLNSKTRYMGEKVRALTKIRQGVIDNQWFKCAILSIVRRCMHDVCMVYA